MSEKPRDALYSSLDSLNEDIGQAHVFIQWKGTDLCGDFRCTCGANHHIDADFVYAIRCTCGLIWQMPSVVAVKPLKEPDGCTYYCEDEEVK